MCFDACIHDFKSRKLADKEVGDTDSSSAYCRRVLVVCFSIPCSYVYMRPHNKVAMFYPYSQEPHGPQITNLHLNVTCLAYNTDDNQNLIQTKCISVVET